MSEPETPYFQLHHHKLEANLAKLTEIERRSRVKILHTLKSFNHPEVTPTIASALSGMSVSAIAEAEMAQKAGAKQMHLYAPAFKTHEFEELAQYASTVSLNS
ncbi:MAG TPA: hypothetical protein ENK86_02025, partial [Campylobacterales bacterium]|nr:hypothetical protein [Campylobacterales bacterium]